MTDRKTLEAQIDELKEQIRELLNRLETAGRQEAEALRPKLKTLQETMRELQKTSAEAWQDMKPGLARAWDELQKSVNQAAARFKNRGK
jgi:predicted  nucleic acid-binding Zn-ribbon protein